MTSTTHPVSLRTDIRTIHPSAVTIIHGPQFVRYVVILWIRLDLQQAPIFLLAGSLGFTLCLWVVVISDEQVALV